MKLTSAISSALDSYPGGVRKFDILLDNIGSHQKQVPSPSHFMVAGIFGKIRRHVESLMGPLA